MGENANVSNWGVCRRSNDSCQERQLSGLRLQKADRLLTTQFPLFGGPSRRLDANDRGWVVSGHSAFPATVLPSPSRRN
jgi:hypothetical protein